MKLSAPPWTQIAKFTAAGLGAVGIFGSGYMTAKPSSTDAAIPISKTTACEVSTITIPLKVFINGKEIKQK